jgi:DNA topoisomerase-1
LKSGRFGPYVQLGDGDEPKRASLPKGWTPDSLTLERALKLLALPRAVGIHPETGKPISAGIGRYGPFVLHDGTYANLPDVEEVFTVGLNRAVYLIAQKAAGGGRFGKGNRAAPQAIKTFEHADGAITVRPGRYGPYVNQGKVNATLPKTVKPEDVTIEQALELIAAKGGSSGKAARKPARGAAGKGTKAAKPATGKASATKAAPKKPSGRKAATKNTERA